MNTCQVCGKPIEQKAGPERKFCSVHCKSKSYGTRRRYSKTCEFCGKEFHPHRETQKTCSRFCAVRIRNGSRARSTAEPFNCKCTECGAKLYRSPSLLKKKTHFCNSSCAGSYRSRVFSGKNNGNYQGAGFRSCEACGKEYKSYDKNRRYCSSDCSAAAAVNTAMTARKQGRYGELLCQRKLESLGYLVVRSMASRGPYDIVAIKPDHILLVQVKSMKRKNQHVIDEAVQLLRESPSTTTAKRQLWCLIGKYKSRVAFSDVTWEVTEV